MKLEKAKCAKMMEGSVVNREMIINYTPEKLPQISKNLKLKMKMKVLTLKL